MIERIPISQPRLDDQHSNINSFVFVQSSQVVDLSGSLSQLYSSTSQRERSIYGVNIYKSEAGSQNQPEGADSLKKAQLQSKTKQYLSWCYFMLNWESVSIANLDTFISSLPDTEDDIQQIRIEGQYLKMAKNDKALVLNLKNGETALEGNRYYLDSYDREGKAQMQEYTRSLCKISIGPEGYRFNGLIRLVESSENFAAVATQESIYIIPLKGRTGSSMRFDISECIDIKWSHRGLYYLQSNGELGLLQRQSTFVPRINCFSQHSTLQLPLSYHPHRICITGTTPATTSVLVLGSAPHNPKRLLLHVVNSARHGIVPNDPYALELKQVAGDILYRNIVSVGGQARVVVVAGAEGRAGRVHMYRLGAI